MGFIGFGLAAGFGFGAWRNVGAVEEPIRAALAFLAFGLLLAGYLAGKARSKRGSSSVAVAVAVAKAQARSSSSAVGNQVLVVNAGSHRSAGDGFGALDAMPWAVEQLSGVTSSDMEAIEEAGEDVDPAEVLFGIGAPRASEAARRSLPGEPPRSTGLWVPGS